MRRFLIYLLLLIPAISIGQEAREIVRKADLHARGNTSQSSMTIKIVRPGWSREMEMKAWSSGNDLALILVTSPPRDKGIVYLKRYNEVWNWIPSIERNIKLPPSMMSQSWMGTDFTNDDLVKEASIVNDYDQTLLGEETIDGKSCYKISMVPLPEASVVWGKVILWIDKNDNIMLKAEYYDEEGELVNTMIASDIKNLGGRQLPSKLEMIPADKDGYKTVLIYHSLQFDKELDKDLFSTQNMSRIQ